MLIGSHRFSNDLNTSPSKTLVHNLHGVEGFDLWKSLIDSFEFLRFDLGSQVL